MVLQTSNTMEPIEVEQKAISRFSLIRLGEGALLPEYPEHLLRLYARLIDKAIQEYNEAYFLINQEVAEQKRPVEKMEKGRELYFHLIVNELENCIITTKRVVNVFRKLFETKETPFSIDSETQQYVEVFGKKLQKIRGVIEHTEKSLIKGELEQNKLIILDLSEDATSVTLGEVSFLTSELAQLLKVLHEICLEIAIYNASTSYDKNFKRIKEK